MSFSARASRSAVSHCQTVMIDHPDASSSAAYCIPIPIGSELRPPIIQARFRSPSFSATVTMPEAAVHKNRLFACGKDDIRSARKISRVQSVSKAALVKNALHGPFRAGVFGSYRLHDPTALFGCSGVCHSSASKPPLMREQGRKRTKGS